ncbi:MAG: sugar O-acetyltransferase [Alphaproteobacteria bacterium]|nr:sugar O-acetyltransferase [Rhizobiaceae bacterium]MBU3963759.1 sugar O-acetyltransferase [Alphaproteobacteria bacterium]MBU4051216.1 sugar O-acetyltransferase [Alphaproteobacteria bacterium]MBU4088601.1 sugar O-acetyltransferase [Alphaproteobacteria bacterium]MBU4155972.1 sugar O-acetyltransferase [Alphaproteobacteria bacterium]
MGASEREKMAAGQWYSCIDPELDRLRIAAREAVHRHNTLPPSDRGAAAPELIRLFAGFGTGAFIEAPFHCAYGFNLTLGDHVYLNAGCVILDTAAVTIGDRSMLGPAVQIYCAEHHKDRRLRSEGQEIARPVSIGTDVWIGGAAVILAGVTIGDGAIVGAGAVVTRDVPAGATVTGNPARVLSPE